MNIRTVFLIVLLFLFNVSVFCENQDIGEGSIIPQDTREFWRVGFSSLSGKNLDKDNLYLTYSIPLLLREALEGIREHTFSNSVIISYRRRVISDEIERDIAKINLLIEKRANLSFNSADQEVREARLREIENKLEKLRGRLNFLRELNPQKIEFKRKKKIKYISAKNSGKLLEAPQYSPMELAQKYDLDLLVWGKIEKIGDIFFLKIEAYEQALGKNVFSYVDAGSRESVYRGVENAVDGLAGVIMGRDWGGLRVSVKPEDSAVYVNGNLVGTGDQEIKFIPTGEVAVSVSRDGYYEKKLKIEVRKGEVERVSFVLKKRNIRRFSINSLPSGAWVYVNSLWIGKTPVTIDFPDNASRITLKKEGFNDYVFSLDSQMKEKSIMVKLTREIVSREKVEEKKRDAFYNAFGYWLITLPISIFSFGLAVDFKVAQVVAVVNNDTGDAQNMSLYSDIMYYAYWGGLFVNASLFINAIVRLVDYINSVD